MLPLLSIKNLSVDFVTDNSVNHAIRDINLELQRGEILAIVGESGSGKSVTSLSILQLLPTPPARYSSGSISFSENGKDQVELAGASPELIRKIRGHQIAMIFQEPMTSLNPVMTCGKQVTEALLAHKHISYKEAKARTIHWFAQVKLPEPEGMYNRYPHQLSGGQKQRVMIAMAICCEPALLICDEPTTALDVTVQKTILELIKELQQQLGMGVLFITHDLGVVSEIADRVAIMYKGSIVEAGEASAIFRSASHPYTKALIACRPAMHPKGEKLPVVSDFLEPLHRQQDTVQKGGTKTTPDVVISVRDLTVKFPVATNLLGKPTRYLKAVDQVSFDIYKGETLGLVGESGCGKTTLGRTLLRLTEASSGNIFYKGNDLTLAGKKEMKRLRKDVQLIFQDPYSSLNPKLNIGSAIAEPMKVTGLGKNDRDRRNKVVELLERVNLSSNMLNRYPHEFSGGQRQRIVIARALALEPDFLVCDESVSALDVSVQAQVLNLLNDLKAELGLTMLFISHDLSVIRYMCDRIMVMNKGKIIETGEAETLYNDPRDPYTRNLIAAIPELKA